MNNNPSKEEIINQAIKFHLQGNIPEATKYYKYCITQGFNDPRIFSNYGAIIQALGKLEEAAQWYRKAINLRPDFASAHYNLGNILFDLGNLKDAELFTRKAINLRPDFANAHFNLGNILFDLGNLKDGEISYRKAIKINPNFANAFSNLGNILFDLDKLKDAEISYRKAIKINPDLEVAYCNLFRHYEKLNNIKKLKESLNEFDKVNCIKNELLLFKARLSFRNKEYKTAKKLIDNISVEWIEKSKNNQGIIFWNYKGFIEDKIENYDLAYHCFKMSQDDPSYLKYNKNLYLNFINSYKKNIKTKKPVSIKFNDEINDSNIVFLVGFPRSGTTLLDSILRSHPQIEVIEEKPFIATIEKLIQEKFNTELYNLYSLPENNLIILRKKYFELLKKYLNIKTKVVIDKLPLNTVSLPLINLLFPNARIIFAHRHPYDTVLSCFQQYFKPNAATANLISLQSSSILYDQVMNAWDAYKNNLSLNFITSKYENLIEKFEDHIGIILEFLGVEWNENVKNYRKTALERSNIITPSYTQIIQPLYKSSVEKWKNYEKYFENCHQYLEKWVSYFEY
ncbi:tetratricopeptide repeat protein [Prochlorococcus sp. AH-716-I09]|nr:tetratricopeptide repeat protein [Prochlorococcus sp. AH-716-I09]